jgi:hypothetical protein
MARKETGKADSNGSVAIHFNLVGLIVFSVSLVLAGGLLALGGLMTARAHSKTTGNNGDDSLRQFAGSADSSSSNARAAQPVPAWGELVANNITVERPDEYIGFEVKSNQTPAWFFGQVSPQKVRNLMLSCGLTASQIDHALSPSLFSVTPTNTVVLPDDDLVLSLSPETRAKFYHELARNPANHYMEFPFNVPGNDPDGWFAGSKVEETVVARIKTLLYPRGSGLCFSDFEFVLRSLPSEQQRMAVVKALSRQPALLVRMHIRPDTDLEKVLGYWDRGLQVKDTRPLLESIQRLPEGGNVSLLYLLPSFARQRLYTYPLPPQPNDPAIDCHWSTMNFFNDPPDDRFANPDYTVQYLRTNFYVVARPSLYGDVVLVLNEQGNAIHSAVYLAEDIVFTKNGNNYAQPWMLMHLKDLLADYSSDGPPKLAVYRNRNW